MKATSGSQPFGSRSQSFLASEEPEILRRAAPPLLSTKRPDLARGPRPLAPSTSFIVREGSRSRTVRTAASGHVSAEPGKANLYQRSRCSGSISVLPEAAMSPLPRHANRLPQ